MARKGKATINPSPGSVMYCFCPALALSRPGGSAIECSCLNLARSRGCGDSAILCFCLATPSRWSRNAGTAIGGSARDFRPLCLPRALPVPVQAQRKAPAWRAVGWKPWGAFLRGACSEPGVCRGREGVSPFYFLSWVGLILARPLSCFVLLLKNCAWLRHPSNFLARTFKIAPFRSPSGK